MSVPNARSVEGNPMREVCADCGQHHPRCSAHPKSVRPKRPCMGMPLTGLTVCRMHGVNGKARAKAKRTLARERLEHELGRQLATLEAAADGKGFEELLADTVRRAHAMAEVLGASVAKLDRNRELWGRERRELAVVIDPGTGEVVQELVDTGRALPHVAVEMYRQWLVDAAKLTKLALDAGVAERRTRIEEAEADMVADAIRAFVGKLGDLLGLDDLLERDDVLDILETELLAIDTTGRELETGSP